MKNKFYYMAAKSGVAHGVEAWVVAKFDAFLFTQEASYEVVKTKRGLQCDCPAGLNRKHQTCKHRLIVRVFKSAKKLGSEKLYDFENKQWVGGYR